MGSTEAKQQEVKPQQKNCELKILAKASSIVKQIGAYQTEGELREQRHLFARILLYGHDHLIDHLRVTPKEQQNLFIRYLRGVDFETLDLLYQNLVLKQLRSDKPKHAYEAYAVLDKFEQKQKHSQKYQSLVKTGQLQLHLKKVAIVVFAGGCSSRFRNEDPSILPKQFYKQKPNQSCLFEIVLKKLALLEDEYGKQTIYIIHNEENHKMVNEELKKYPQLQPKKVLQNQYPVVNLSGKVCLKGEKLSEILLAPSGCGDFVNLSLRNKKLIEDILAEDIEYVCTVSVDNIQEIVADPYTLGMLAADRSLSVVFKCTHPENQNENLRRVVVNKKSKRIEVGDLEALLNNSEKQNASIIRRSPVWMNNACFKTGHLSEYLEKKKQNFNISQVFTPKKTKYSYWNSLNKEMQLNQHCYIFERELNDLLIVDALNCVGVRVFRQQQYMPVVSINNEKTWADAYQYYQSSQNTQPKKKQPLINQHISVVSMRQDSDDERL